MDCLIRVESHEDPIAQDANLEEYQEAWAVSPLLHTRLMTMVKDISFNIVDSTEGNGIEAWRLLSRKWNPTTHARCAQLVAEIISFRISRNEEVLSSLVKWEAKISTLQRDHKETMSDKMKIGCLLMVLPKSL